MVAQIIVTPSDTLLDAVRFVVFQVIVQLFQLHLGFLVPRVHPVKIEGRQSSLSKTLRY